MLSLNGAERATREQTVISFRTYALQFGIAALAVVLCLWAATQWAAAMLGHQAALGPAWIDAVGLKIYAPWQLFVWWLAFDAQAPDVFARAGTVAAFGGLASGAVAIGGAARRASRKQQATTYGSARWADVFGCQVDCAARRCRRCAWSL